MTTDSRKTRRLKTETREFKISYDNFESAIVAWLYSVGGIPQDMDVTASDFGLEVDDEGMVTFDLELTRLPGRQREFTFEG